LSGPELDKGHLLLHNVNYESQFFIAYPVPVETCHHSGADHDKTGDNGCGNTPLAEVVRFLADHDISGMPVIRLTVANSFNAFGILHPDILRDQ